MTIKSTELRSRVEPDLKESAAEVLAQCGLTLSDAIRLFLRQVVLHNGLPFEVKVPTAETRAAMEEARSITRARFGSGQELIDDLEKNTRSRKAR
ncbi:type II toxin-antitoxin system RelB/DinJ family antitoxin [Roseateles amylovorans]|uniref:Type II toxin-antitoxin system RelB/DinJ family antitoxin n=1 Tax=Roseateles amylovorans TaxID=2978473 RepID=A0ABY6B548_9BURK|nr:type II toxin-antitoxin system RelB/DinJ family antitoxin [Roseateles amylovorans]UXH78678.1 type II toxin-antitoxin system RelB/DinJ family antitoxin [Roseateles amylovorans]